MNNRILMRQYTVGIYYDPVDNDEADAVIEKFPADQEMAAAIAEVLEKRSDEWAADRMLIVRVGNRTEYWR